MIVTEQKPTNEILENLASEKTMRKIDILFAVSDLSIIGIRTE